MYTLTFKLENRVKTFTDTTVEGAYEMFLIGYGEVLDELKHVEIDGGHPYSQVLNTHQIDAKSFRKQYRHIEDKVGDNVTETISKEPDPVLEKFREWKHDIYEANRIDWDKSDDDILEEMLSRIEKGGA